MSLVCALALSLVIDVSSSIDREEYKLQMEGLAQAFRSERVARIVDNDNPVALNVIFFDSTARVVVPWVVLNNHEELYTLATRLENTPYPSGMYTNVHDGLRLALDSFNNVPCTTENYTVDISGDGENNVGRHTELEPIIQTAQEMGVRINTLPIMTHHLDEENRKLFNYFNDNYAAPTGGFTIGSNGFEDFARAIFQKLTREIAQNEN